MRIDKRFFVLAALFGLALPVLSKGEESPLDARTDLANPPELPVTVAPVEADRPVPETPALRISRRDAERASYWAETLRQQAEEAADRLQSAQSQLAETNAAKSKAEQVLAGLPDELKQAEQANQAAEQSVAESETALKKVREEQSEDEEAVANATKAVEEAKRALTDSEARLTALRAKQTEAENSKQAAEKRIPELQESIKQFTEAKGAADKQVAEAEEKVRLFTLKAEAFAQAAPVANPEAIRLEQTFQYQFPMFSCRFDSEGTHVIAGAHDRHLLRWNLLTGSETRLEGHRSWVRRFSVHPDGKHLITGGYEGQLIWWDITAETPEPLRSIPAHRGYIRGVAVSPNGEFIATGGNDKLVKIWSAADGALVQELAGHEGHVYNVAFHPDGRHLVSGDLYGVLKQWEVGSWNHIRDLDATEVLHKYDNSFRADCGGIRGMDFSPDGKWLVVCGIGEVTNAFAGVGKPTAVLFDWESGEREAVMLPEQNFQGTCWSIRFHPSGEFIVGAGGGGSGSLWFWRPGEEKSFFDFKLPQVGYDIVFHPDELRVAIALYNKTLCIYDMGPAIEVADAEQKPE